jgi:hypothetical protein
MPYFGLQKLDMRIKIVLGLNPKKKGRPVETKVKERSKSKEWQVRHPRRQNIKNQEPVICFMKEKTKEKKRREAKKERIAKPSIHLRPLFLRRKELHTPQSA